MDNVCACTITQDDAPLMCLYGNSTPSAIRKHMGPRMTATKSTRGRVKTSTLRRQQLMGDVPSPPCAVLDGRPRDMRTQAQITGLIEWVGHFLSG
jgi:hypothetical protein